MGRTPKPPCQRTAHPDAAEVRDRCLPPNRGKAAVMAVAKRRRRGTADESGPDCSGCVGATLLRSRRKARSRPATPSIAHRRVADDENFGPAGHPQVRSHPYATSRISLNPKPSRRRRVRLLSAQEKTLAFMGARVSRPDGVRGWGLRALHPALGIQRRARPCGSLPGKAQRPRAAAMHR
jgi:hypothetical protein